jgi:hypothetical protein
VIETAPGEAQIDNNSSPMVRDPHSGKYQLEESSALAVRAQLTTEQSTWNNQAGTGRFRSGQLVSTRLLQRAEQDSWRRRVQRLGEDMQPTPAVAHPLDMCRSQGNWTGNLSIPAAVKYSA